MTIHKMRGIDPRFRKSHIRHYWFAEALAVYERSHHPLVSTYLPRQQELTPAGRMIGIHHTD